MVESITAKYVQENDDWAVTVSGGEKQLTGRAPGIIAARDSVDQIVEKLGADFKGATVVHLLNGSALEFTAAYIAARFTRGESAPLEVPEPSSPVDDKAPEAAESVVENDEAAEPAAEQASKPQNKASRRPKAKLTTDIGDALESAAKPKLPAVTGTVSVAKVPSAQA